MTRFAVFQGDSHYPAGGWEDFAGTFETIEAAKAALSAYVDWAQIVDLELGTIVLAWAGWYDKGHSPPVYEWREYGWWHALNTKETK